MYFSPALQSMHIFLFFTIYFIPQFKPGNKRSYKLLIVDGPGPVNTPYRMLCICRHSCLCSYYLLCLDDHFIYSIGKPIGSFKVWFKSHPPPQRVFFFLSLSNSVLPEYCKLHLHVACIPLLCLYVSFYSSLFLHCLVQCLAQGKSFHSCSLNQIKF